MKAKGKKDIILGILFICLLIGNTTNFFCQDQKTLICGWQPWPPFQYQDEKGSLTGLDVELVVTILNHMGYEAKWKQYPWKRLLRSLELGWLHMIPGASKTGERKKYAYYSQSYRDETVALFVRKEDLSKYEINHIKDILNLDFKLAVSRGAYYGEEFTKLMNNPQFRDKLVEVSGEFQGIHLLALGRFDGFLSSPFTGKAIIQNEKYAGKIVQHPLPLLVSGKIYIMFSKKSTTPEIVDKFNKSLEQLKANGTIQTILNKYQITKKK